MTGEGRPLSRHVRTHHDRPAGDATAEREAAASPAHSDAEGAQRAHRVLRARSVRIGPLASPRAPAALITFCYITGWRWLSEVVPLRCGQVDLHAGIVRLDAGTTKNDEPRSFAFGAITELRDLLTTQVKPAETLSRDTGQIVSHVFHEPDGCCSARTPSASCARSSSSPRARGCPRARGSGRPAEVVGDAARTVSGDGRHFPRLPDAILDERRSSRAAT